MDIRLSYAKVTDGVRYSLRDVSGTLARWRRQIEALRALGPTNA